MLVNPLVKDKANYVCFGQKKQKRLKISIYKYFIRLNSCTLIEEVIVFVIN